MKFQYKICYSKIDFSAMLSGADPNFNTKFVIAKSGVLMADFCSFLNFNTKFVIAKLRRSLKITRQTRVFEFQYKICYSKIFLLKNAGENDNISIQNLL